MTSSSLNDVTLNNTPKFILLFAIACGVFVLVGIGKITWSDGQPILLMEVGYIVGNGVAAMRKEPVKPMLINQDMKEG